MRQRSNGTRADTPTISPYPRGIDGLLDDVRHLRHTMASDLSAAATALESDARDVARDIIEANREALAALEKTSRCHTVRGDPTDDPPPERRPGR